MTFFADPSFQERVTTANISSDDDFRHVIWILNSCLDGRKADMMVGIHLCRGNAAVRMPSLANFNLYYTRLMLYEKDGKYFATGSYEKLATRLFKELNVDTYYVCI